MTVNANKRQFVLIYATQTGQAKAIAEGIYDEAKDFNYEPKMHSIDEYFEKFGETGFSELIEPLVLVSSTTGDGEVPESATRFYNHFKRLEKSTNTNPLARLNYALLGLGDSNYAQFCNGPKLIYSVFSSLGAKCFYGPVWADDGVGLELEVEPFKESLWSALDSFLAGLPIDNSVAEPHLANSNPKSKQPEKKQKEESIDNLTQALRLLGIADSEISQLSGSAGAMSPPPPPVEKHLSIEFLSTTNAETKFEFKQLLDEIHAPRRVYECTLIDKRVLTAIDSEKCCLQLRFRLSGGDGVQQFVYEPGHAVDIICSNEVGEVEALFDRLLRSNSAITAADLDRPFRLMNNEPGKIAGRAYAQLTNKLNNLSLRSFFTNCVDIRHGSLLKKATLRMLGEYCANERQKQLLVHLSSAEGGASYEKLVRQQELTILDLLNVFESCAPPIDHLIQMLPPLRARPYSLCTSAGTNSDDDIMEIIFNRVDISTSKEHLRTYSRNGVCTGYLSRLEPGEKFYVCARSFQTFTLPRHDHLSDQHLNLIMIGPGTGLAPFMSFMRYRRSINEALAHGKQIEGKWWLFYGCRHPTKDFLYKEELNGELGRSTLYKLSVTHSRYEPNEKNKSIDHYELDCKYVQDAMKRHGQELCELVINQNAFVYVCGDAKHMSKDVFNAFVDCLHAHGNNEMKSNRENAETYLKEMLKLKRYKEDIWH
jgi:methionine synthase reductase